MSRARDRGETAAKGELDSPGLIALCRILHQSEARVIGLYPARSDDRMIDVSLLIASALAALTGVPMAVVESWRRWPKAKASGARPSQGSLRRHFHERPGRGGAMTLSLEPARTPEAAAAALGAALPEARKHFGHVLVDLDDLEPETVVDIGALDGVAVVARAGRVRAGRLHALTSAFPAAKQLGVLLFD